MKAVLLLSLPLLSMLALIGCSDQTAKFDKSLEDILSIEKKRRGVIFAHEGAPGPYREAGGTTGNVNSAGSIQAGEGAGRTKITWPATEGHFYEGTAYLNASNGAYLVVRKIPAP